MPKTDYAYLLLVCERLASQHRENALPAAVRWKNRLLRPLCQGPHVDSFTVLQGPVRT